MNHMTAFGLRELMLSAAILSLSTAASASLSYQPFTFGSDGVDRLSDGAVAPDQSVFLVGTTSGSYAAANAGGNDVVLMRMSPTGSILWSRQFGTADGESGPRITLASDALYVQHFAMTSVPSPSPYTTLSKFDLSGTLLWSRSLPSWIGSRPILDQAGNVYMAGTTAGAWIQKYDSNGNALSYTSLASPVSGAPHSITRSRDGGLFVLGKLVTPTQGSSGVYVRKYDATGTELWTSELDSADVNMSAVGLAEDAQGNLRVICNSAGSIIPPGGGGVSTGSTTQARLVSLDAQGVFRGSDTVSFVGSASDVAVDANGRVYIAGIPGGGMGEGYPYVAIYGSTLENSLQVDDPSAYFSISGLAVGGPSDIYLLGARPYVIIGTDNPVSTSDFAIIHLVPEPSSALLLTGLATLTLAARRKRLPIIRSSPPRVLSSAMD